MEPHADFAAALSQHLIVATATDRGDGHRPISGRVISLGWWVQPGTENDPTHEPSDTLYLVADENRPRPRWIRPDALTSVRIAA